MKEVNPLKEVSLLKMAKLVSIPQLKMVKLLSILQLKTVNKVLSKDMCKVRTASRKKMDEPHVSGTKSYARLAHEVENLPFCPYYSSDLVLLSNSDSFLLSMKYNIFIHRELNEWENDLFAPVVC